MSRYLLWSLALTGLLVAGGPAGAQVIYEFANGATGAAQNSFTVTAGQQVPVRVYIRETAAGAPTLNSQGGLSTGAVRVTFSNPLTAGINTLADVVVASPTPWTGGGTPGPTGAGPTSTSVTMLGFSPASGTVGILPDAQGRILIGTVTLTGRVIGSMQLTAVDPNPTAQFDTASFAFNPTTFVPNINYDPLLSATVPSATINVVAIPEPGSLALAGLAATAFAVVRRRRRAAPVAPPAA